MTCLKTVNGRQGLDVTKASRFREPAADPLRLEDRRDIWYTIPMHS
jgi:hypothetical protein